MLAVGDARGVVPHLGAARFFTSRSGRSTTRRRPARRSSRRARRRRRGVDQRQGPSARPQLLHRVHVGGQVAVRAAPRQTRRRADVERAKSAMVRAALGAQVLALSRRFGARRARFPAASSASADIFFSMRRGFQRARARVLQPGDAGVPRPEVLQPQTSRRYRRPWRRCAAARGWPPALRIASGRVERAPRRRWPVSIGGGPSATVLAASPLPMAVDSPRGGAARCRRRRAGAAASARGCIAGCIAAPAHGA